MAARSAATKRASRDAAGYRTGVARLAGAARCDNCAEVRCVPACERQTAHDRNCLLHGCRVKTHGCCDRHLSKEA